MSLYEKQMESIKKADKRTKSLTGFFWTIVILCFVLSFALKIAFALHKTEYIGTVTGKDRIVERNEEDIESKYLIFVKDTEGQALVFENTDSLFYLKFDSSNIQAKLEEGHKFKFIVAGYRIPFFSCYENIIKIEEIQED